MKRDVSIALLMRIFGSGVWLLYIIFMARFLPKAEFGSLVYAINLALVMAPIATLGFETSTIKHASRYWADDQKDLFSSLLQQARFMAATGGTIFLVILFIFWAAGVNSPATDTLLSAGLTGVAITLASIMGIHRDTLRAADKIEFAFLGFSVIRTVLPLIFGLALAAADLLSVTTAMITFIAALGISLIIETWAIRRLKAPKPSKLSPEIRRSHVAVASKTWLGDMAHVILMRAPGIMVGMLTDLETLALFLAAERIANLGQFITDAVRAAVAPVIARACAPTVALATTQSELKKISIMMLKTGSVDALLLALIGWPALYLMGPDFTAAYPLILLAILVQAGWVATGPCATFMNMIGLEIIRTIGAVTGAILLCVGIWFFVSSGQVANALIIQAVVIWGLNLNYVALIKFRTGVKIGLWALLASNTPEKREAL